MRAAGPEGPLEDDMCCVGAGEGKIGAEAGGGLRVPTCPQHLRHPLLPEFSLRESTLTYPSK